MAICPKCRTNFKALPGVPIACPECGQKLKFTAAKPEPAAVGARAEVDDIMPPPHFSREILTPLLPPALPAGPAEDVRQPAPAPVAAPGIPYLTTPPDNSISGGAAVLIGVRAVLWLACIAWVGLCLVNHIQVQAQHKDMSAIQQAALGVETCVWVISAYVVCRGIDSATRV